MTREEFAKKKNIKVLEDKKQKLTTTELKSTAQHFLALPKQKTS